MGEIALLQPRDCLKNRFSRRNLTCSAMKSGRNSTPNVPKPPDRRRKTTSPPSKPGLVMGQVKILKRGETLTNHRTPDVHQNLKADEVVTEVKAKETEYQRKNLDVLMVTSTDRLGPEPDVLAKKLSVADLFASAVTTNSPDPSSLPVPSFLLKIPDPSSTRIDLPLLRASQT